jgi:hypothetical protein
MPQLVGPGRFSDALYAALDRERGYELSIVDGVINIAPPGSAAVRDHFLNQPLGTFRVTDLTTARAVLMLRLRLAHQDESRAMTDPLRPMSPDLEQRSRWTCRIPRPGTCSTKLRAGTRAWRGSCATSPKTRRHPDRCVKKTASSK